MPQNEERIPNVPKRVNAELNAISKNIGITKTQLLQKKIREKINSYPDYLKEKMPPCPKEEVRITSIAQDLQEDIENIARNIGVDKAVFMRVLISDISTSYPEKTRRFTSRD